MKEVERGEIQTCNRLEIAKMKSSSAAKDVNIFIGSKLSLQLVLTAKTTNCMQGCTNRCMTVRLSDSIIFSILPLFRPHLDMASSFAPANTRETTEARSGKAISWSWRICSVRLRVQGLFG